MELTIITPSCRPQFLPKLYDSINFDKITKWIIVHDTSKNIVKHNFKHPKIVELDYDKGTTGGGVLRTKGLKLVKSGFVYFLDDDNIMHPNFWKLLPSFNLDKFYTFNQIRDNKSNILYGNRIQVRYIDTAMFIIPMTMIGDTIWEDKYCSDGKFVEDIYKNNKDKHVFINEVAAYYNYLHPKVNKPNFFKNIFRI